MFRVNNKAPTAEIAPVAAFLPIGSCIILSTMLSSSRKISSHPTMKCSNPDACQLMIKLETTDTHHVFEVINADTLCDRQKNHLISFLNACAARPPYRMATQDQATINLLQRMDIKCEFK